MSIGLLLASEADARRRIAAWLVIGMASALLLNARWLLPFFTHLGDEAAMTIQQQLPIFKADRPMAFVFDYLRPGGYWTFRPTWWINALRLSLMVSGIIGVIALIRSPRRNVGFVLGGTAVFLFVLTYFGSLVPRVASLQPLRFKVALDLVLCLGAGVWLASSWRRSGATKWFAVIALGTGTVAGVLCIGLTESHRLMTLRTAQTSGLESLVTWISQNTPAESRLLFEESGDETGFVYDGRYLSSFLPYWTGRQLIGGPINIYNDRHHFAEFHSGRLFGHDITSLSDQQIADYLRTYNISAIVTFTPQSVQRFLHQPNVVESAQLGPLHLLIVDQPLTWFLKGSGTVDASLNHLRLSNLAGDDVVLKYHWVAGLRASPDATIETVYELDDPIPFIRLVKPPASLDLSIRRP